MAFVPESEGLIPYYFQVAQTIKSRILAGQFAPGDLIPSYRVLEAEFKVSSTTVRRAIELLVQDGLVKRKWGVGTAVCARGDDSLTFEMVGDFQALRYPVQKFPLTTRVLEIGSDPGPASFRRAVGVAGDEELWCMRKLRLYGTTVVAYYVTHSLQRWCGSITPEEAEEYRFTDLFNKKSGLKLKRLEQQIRSTTADLDLSPFLQLNFGAPILFIENTYYSVSEQVVASTHICYRGDKSGYKISVPL